jgi:hypothetical protein
VHGLQTRIAAGHARKKNSSTSDANLPANREGIACLVAPGVASFWEQDRLSCALPGRANATIRSPADAGSRHHGLGRNGSDVFNTLIYWDNFADSKATMSRPSIGRGEAGAFAPFVYRLGRHPFTVERAVRFR